MKIDSEYLNVDLEPEYGILDATLIQSGYTLEIWDDGDIFVTGIETELCFNVKELEEIVRVAKLFKNRRDFYLANKS